MISYLKGLLQFKKPPILVVDINGLGYECQAPMSTFYNLPSVGEPVFLHTHLAVREDAHVLYAFLKDEERSLFRSLIKVSNVGPKLALAILSGIEIDHFVRSIKDQDVATLTRVPGVGKKTAERLVIELRDRLDDGAFQTVTETIGPKELENRIMQDALSALVALGFKPQEASRLIAGVKTDYNSTEDLIRQALQTTLK